MKRLLLFVGMLLIVATTFAQLPKLNLTKKLKTLSTVSANGLTVAINPVKADTVKSGDTLFYKVPINHSFKGYPYISLLQKLVTADTVATLTFWQSVDGANNWQQVLNTASPTAWAITLAKGNTGTDISFWRSIGWFESNWLGIRIIAKPKSNHKKIFYGSIRFDNY